MKYAVWGTGVRGDLAVSFLGKDNIVVFIDESQSKQGSIFLGKNVVSFNEYLKNNNDCYIVVTPNDCNAIINQLKEHNIKHYSLLKDIIY